MEEPCGFAIAGSGINIPGLVDGDDEKDAEVDDDDVDVVEAPDSVRDMNVAELLDEA